MRKKFFFEATQSAVSRLTAAYDELSSSLIALWQLSSEVKGVIELCPSISENALDRKFNVGSGVRWSNYKKVFVDQEWQKHRAFFAWMLLNATCSVFDGWLDQVLRFWYKDRKIREGKMKKCQNPDSAAGTIAEIVSADASDLMRKTFYSVYAAHPKYSYGRINLLLHCYRAFKEIRNCYRHCGCVANEECVCAWQNYLEKCTTENMGLKEIPQRTSPQKGVPIGLSFRDVVGLTDVVMRIIISYDVELLGTAKGFQYFLNRYRAVNKFPEMFSSKKSTAHSQFAKCVRKCGFMAPCKIGTLKSALCL